MLCFRVEKEDEIQPETFGLNLVPWQHREVSSRFGQRVIDQECRQKHKETKNSSLVDDFHIQFTINFSSNHDSIPTLDYFYLVFNYALFLTFRLPNYLFKPCGLHRVLKLPLSTDNHRRQTIQRSCGTNCCSSTFKYTHIRRMFSFVDFQQWKLLDKYSRRWA